MPPPPPSASYLWKIVDSSDEEEEAQPVSMRTQTKTTEGNEEIPSSIDNNKAAAQKNRNNANSNNNETRIRDQTTPETVPNEEEEEDDVDNENEEELEQGIVENTPTTRRKRRKKKKKKKKNTNTNNSTAVTSENASTVTVSEKNSHHIKISFGDVSVHFFERRLGINGVPLDGGWPLGLRGTQDDDKEDEEEENKSYPVESIPKTQEADPSINVSVDDYEKAKQQWLLERWNKLQEAENNSNSNNGSGNTNNTTATNPPPPALIPFETRQWDHKASGVKNPLFGLLVERERMALLLGEAADIDDVLVERIHRKQQREAEKKKMASSPSNQRKTRSRSGSFEQGQRARSGSFESNPSRRTSGSSHRNSKLFGNEERYNSTFTEYKVHHVRNELENIRNQRSQDSARGCTCRKMTVYIPPPNAGKKAAHRRLNFKMLCQELRHRQALPPEPLPSREELEWKLHDLVEQEGCCQSKNCPCFASGIGCQSDVCQCWHASHQFKSSRRKGNGAGAANDAANKKSQEVTPELIRTRCGNSNGMYTTDLDTIQQYRNQVLEKIPICPVATD